MPVTGRVRQHESVRDHRCARDPEPRIEQDRSEFVEALIGELS
jgi:hypothetical protein